MPTRVHRKYTPRTESAAGDGRAQVTVQDSVLEDGLVLRVDGRHSRPSHDLDHLAAADAEATAPKILCRSAQVDLAEEGQSLRERSTPPVRDNRVRLFEVRRSEVIVEERETTVCRKVRHESPNPTAKLRVCLQELGGGCSMSEYA